MSSSAFTLIASFAGDEKAPSALAFTSPAARYAAEGTVQGMRYGNDAILLLRCETGDLSTSTAADNACKHLIKHNSALSWQPDRFHLLRLRQGSCIPEPLLWWLRRCDSRGVPLALHFDSVTANLVLSAENCPSDLFALNATLTHGGSFDVEKNLEALKPVRCIFFVNKWNDCARILHLEALRKLTSLELLVLRGGEFDNLTPFSQHKRLRSTLVEVSSSSAFLPVLPALTSLRSFVLQGCIFPDDLSVLQQCSNLTTLSFCKCRSARTVSFDNMEPLRSLSLSFCDEVQALDVTSCTGLEELSVVGCVHLTEVIGLETLVYLRDLEIVSDSFPGEPKLLVNLSTQPHLETAKLSHCRVRGLESDRTSPISKLQQHALRTLNLVGVADLTTLDLAECRALTDLHVEALSSLTTLLLKGTAKLKRLTVKHCDRLQTVTLDTTPSLEQLTLEKVLYALTNVVVGETKPAAFLCAKTGLTKTLRTLAVKECRVPSASIHLIGFTFLVQVELQQAEGIEQLSFAGCTAMESIHIVSCRLLTGVYGIGGLPRLKELTVKKCAALAILSPFTDAHSSTTSANESLIELTLDCLPTVEQLNFKGFTTLRSASIIDSKRLRAIYGVRSSPSLQFLEVRRCSSLKHLLPPRSEQSARNTEDNFVNKSLKHLKLHCLDAIEEVSFNSFNALASVTIFLCKSLHIVSGVETLPSLKLLEVKDCQSLENLSPFTEARSEDTAAVTFVNDSLTTLLLENDSAIERLSVEGFIALRSAHMIGCLSLKTISGVRASPSLKRFEVNNCPAFTSLSASSDTLSAVSAAISTMHDSPTALVLANLRTLRHLSLEGFNTLKVVTIVDCDLLETINDVNDVPALEKLHVERCPKLSSFPPFTDTPSNRAAAARANRFLLVLQLYGLPSLLTWDLSGLSLLRRLELGGCNGLTALTTSTELPDLRSIWINDVERFVSLDCSKFISVTEIALRACPSLRTIIGLDRKARLEDARFTECRQLSTISLQDCTGIGQFRAVDCDELTEVSGLNTTSLRLVVLRQNPSLLFVDCLRGVTVQTKDCPKLQRATTGLFFFEHS